MAKNQPKMIDGSKYSAWQVLEAANAYYALSNVFTRVIPSSMAEVNAANLNMDDCVASATNRILALELYLKALFIGGNLGFPALHDLAALYKALPANMRIDFERIFDARCKAAHGGDIVWQLSMSFQLCNDPASAKLGAKKATPPADITLPGLLSRNQYGFVVSRYLFESASHHQVETFEYEFRRLAILCSILCETLEISIPNRAEGYKRTFNFSPKAINSYEQRWG